MMTSVAPRIAWTGTKPKRVALNYSAVRYVVIHYPGSPVAKISSDIPALLRGWYTDHTKSRGWTDIGYNYAVDQTGKIWTLRGDYRDGATLGYGGKSVSILVVLGNNETPSDKMLSSVRTFAEMLRGKSAKGCKIVGHRDLVKTSCPGDKIHAWIKKGLPVKETPKPKPTAVKFWVGSFNMQEQAHGGLSDTSVKRGKFLRDEVKASIYALQECPEKMRDAIKGQYSKWLSYASASVCLLWNREKWQYNNKAIADVKWTKYHAALRVGFTHVETRRAVDFVTLHVPPAVHWAGKSDTFIHNEKRECVREAMTRLIRPGYPTVIAGDFNLETVDDILAGFGATLVSAVPHKGSLIDRVYMIRGKATQAIAVPNPTSDHNGAKIHGVIS